ncbi:MAG: hypothetical protein Q4A34_03680 [Candidatus Saccharibacteria bacterium]|nr:hypothetical protein [Candidatus Saccharibacteria bacterium]
MKTLQRYIKQYAERIAASVMGLAIAIALTGVGVLAYGPQRTTFTIEKPATYITFNSITNNRDYGDERNFVIAKDAAHTQAGGWSDNVKIQDGKEYLVRMYVHNNAAANLNLRAINTRVMANVPRTEAKSHRIDGYVSADNAKPNQVYDHVHFSSDKDFTMTYVAGSARYYNNLNPKDGYQLPDAIVTQAGAQVGYEKMNGVVPGCFQYSGIATFKLRAETKKAPNFTVNKQVRIAGTADWKDTITAKPGDMVEYRIGYDNTGQAKQQDVVVQDVMDRGLQYVTGSSLLYNAANKQGKQVSDNTHGKGVNIGHYAANSNAYLQYKAKVAAKEQLSCGTTTLKNTATVITGNGKKSDDATVTVTTACDKPIEVCEVSTKKIVTIDERDIKQGKHSKNLSDCAAPTELPRTGPAGVAGLMAVVAVVVVGVTYYIRHRQEKQRAAEATFGKHIAAPEVKLLESKRHNDTK